MSNINWHAYLDGSLDPATRAEADRRLETDPEARLALENLKLFVASVRRESLSEAVPIGRIHTRMPRAVKPHAWTVGGIGLALAAAALWVLVFARTPVHEEKPIDSFADASQWIHARTGMDVPSINLSFGRLVASERTADSGCFCMVIDGKMVHLGFTKNMAMDPGLQEAPRGGREFRAGPSMVSFKAGGLLWIVKGDSKETVWKAALAASEQLRPRA